MLSFLWFYDMLLSLYKCINIQVYELVQENSLFWTKWRLNIEMFAPFFRRFLFFVLSSKILEALYAQG